MLSDTFYWLLNMSIVASLVGCVLLLLRLIPRLPRRVLYPLWAVVLLRLCTPLGIASDFSILKLLPHKSVTFPGFPDSMPGANAIMVADDYFPIVFHSRSSGFLFTIASAVWATVAAILLLILLTSYGQAIRQSRHAKHWMDRLYISECVSGPMVCGILRPRILLPQGWEGRDLELILAHERIHIRRLDNLWRLMGLVAACVHWFNPLIWLFLKCFISDMELSCDEAVLRKLSAEQRTDYARTLLGSAQRQSLLLSPFGHAPTSQRIRNILSYRRLSAAATLFLSIAAACICVLLLTNSR